MADLVAADVTLTVQTAALPPSGQAIMGAQRKIIFSVAFGDGAKTYPAGGVPVPAFGNWGMWRSLDYIDIVDIANASGLLWKWDFTNKKLRAYQSGSFTPAGTNSAPTITISGGQAGTVATGISSDANGAALSKTTATDRTGITGVQAPTFTGTVVAAAALAELGNVAVAATTMIVEAYGW